MIIPHVSKENSEILEYFFNIHSARILNSYERVAYLLLEVSENAAGAYMNEFVTSQVLGLDGLVNLSNIVFLVAFSTRDVLRLRVLSLVGECFILPYYYFQKETLWAPIFWGVAFTAVNVVRIIALALERRPVFLGDQEE